MNDILKNLYNTAIQRRETRLEGSYTCYLFDQGLDKILKKCGEECAEVIIAAKNSDNAGLVCEISDLLYHLAVLMAERGVSHDDVRAELEKRAAKEKNLKEIKSTDKNT